MIKEEVLISKLKKQDEEAFEEIYEKYCKLVFLVINNIVHDKEVTKELTSDTFMKMYKSISTFDSSKKFSPWLTTIARNTAINYVNRDKDKHLVYNEEIVNSTEDNNNDEAIKIISTLEGLEQKIVELKIMNNCTYSEISQILNISKSEVYRKYNSGIQKIKNSIIK